MSIKGKIWDFLVDHFILNNHIKKCTILMQTKLGREIFY